MVSPISTNNANVIQSVAKPVPTTAVNQVANRNVGQAVLNKTQVASKTVNDTQSSTDLTKLASANNGPQSNLPRGSIVDRLV